MIPEFYQKHLKADLSNSQFLTLEILVWLLQVHKQVKIERLATLLSTGIESHVCDPKSVHFSFSISLSISGYLLPGQKLQKPMPSSVSAPDRPVSH